MKLSKKLIFSASIILVSSFVSCSKKEIGFFHQSNPRYETKKTTPSNITPETITASNHPNDHVDAKKTFIDDRSTIASAKHLTPESTPVDQLATSKSIPSKAEKKQIKKDIKEALKQQKQNETSVSTFLLVIFAIILPPLAVVLVDGLISGPFILSILLTIIFYLPGLIYALFRIFRK